MIRCGRREQRVATQMLVTDERSVVTFQQKFTREFLKPYGPIKRFNLMLAPGIRVQVVNDVSAADDENALIAQRFEVFRQLVMKLGRPRFINAELYDGNICLRENVTQHGPRSMIKSPTVIQCHWNRR